MFLLIFNRDDTLNNNHLSITANSVFSNVWPLYNNINNIVDTGYTLIPFYKSQDRTVRNRQLQRDDCCTEDEYHFCKNELKMVVVVERWSILDADRYGRYYVYITDVSRRYCKLTTKCQYNERLSPMLDGLTE
ncbi:hypothetical protein ACF0H5_023424 [Mactra antiquata]